VKVDTVLQWFMPKEKGFRELFARDTTNLLRGVRSFQAIAHSASLEERRVKMVELRAIEHEGDVITREIFDALNSTFITPLDREDIRGISTDLDDILDFLEGSAQHLVLFELEESPEALRRFADILVAMCVEVEIITSLLWDLSNAERIHEAMVRISDLENEADALHNTVIADLFKRKDLDPIEILKWKDVYQGLEDACDECKEYTHVIGNIVTKNA
jgi:predicted phosphate transport protein (TIGR00153 family)